MNLSTNPGQKASDTLDVGAKPPESSPDAPRNGLAGLEHWRHDLMAGLVVSLVSLPLSSGIAIASGAPPIYGIISSIIAGLVFPFVGGSFVTISGPAAGLAPALLAIMVALGGAGDADHVGAGYHMLLVVIFLTGLLQVVMAKLKLARFAAVFPASVVEGMLGAIGVLILVKALPLFTGYLQPVHAHGFLEYLGEVPHWFAGGHGGALAVGVLTLVGMLAWDSRFAKRWVLPRTVPPHLVGVVLGGGLAAFLGMKGINPLFFVEVPANPLDGVSLPDFGGLLTRRDLWGAALVGVLTLSMIDGVESLATAQAIDRIDPFKRKSEPNRLLAAMGISNMISSLVGGLTVIPGGVKSKTNIEAGGRTLWANFVNAAMLLVFLFVAPGLVAMMPKAALGGILVYTGWKMMHPAIARHLAHVGWEQLVLYMVTIAATLLTDLLIGVAVGTMAKMLLLTLESARVRTAVGRPAGLWQIFADLFRDPVTGVDREQGRAVVHVERPLVCFNAYRLHERIAGLRTEDVEIVLVMGPGALVVDHTAMEGVKAAADEVSRLPLIVQGLEQMQCRGSHPCSMHRIVR